MADENDHAFGITIGGHTIKAVPMEECAKATYHVCSPVRCFPDDLEHECVACKRAIYGRPYMPPTVPKICIECALLTMKDPN